MKKVTLLTLLMLGFASSSIYVNAADSSHWTAGVAASRPSPDHTPMESPLSSDSAMQASLDAIQASSDAIQASSEAIQESHNRIEQLKRERKQLCYDICANPKELVRLGRIYMADKQYKDAETWFLVAEGTEDPAAYVALGDLAQELGDLVTTKKYYSKAIEKNFGPAHTKLGTLRVKLNQIDRAIFHFEKAAKEHADMMALVKLLICANKHANKVSIEDRKRFADLFERFRLNPDLQKIAQRFPKPYKAAEQIAMKFAQCKPAKPQLKRKRTNY